MVLLRLLRCSLASAMESLTSSRANGHGSHYTTGQMSAKQSPIELNGKERKIIWSLDVGVGDPGVLHE